MSEPEPEPEPEPAAALVGDMIAALGSGEALVQAGTFTLDTALARRKQRERRLAKPERWILFFVEAAWLLGGRELSVDFGVRQIELSFGGLALGRADLERLYDPLAHRDDDDDDDSVRRRRAVERLALAFEAAFACDAHHIELLCVPPASPPARADASSMRRAVRAGAPALSLIEDELPARTTAVVTTGLATGKTELRQLLAEACRYSSIRVEVAGESEPLNTGLGQLFEEHPQRASRLHTIRGEAGESMGYAWLSADAAPATLRLLTRGVFANTVRLSDLRPGFMAIVDTDLQRDIGEAKLRRGPAFDALIARMHTVSEELVPTTLATREARDVSTDRRTPGGGTLVIAGFSALLAGSILNPLAGLACLILGGTVALAQRRRARRR